MPFGAEDSVVTVVTLVGSVVSELGTLGDLEAQPVSKDMQVIAVNKVACNFLIKTSFIKRSYCNINKGSSKNDLLFIMAAALKIRKRNVRYKKLRYQVKHLQ